VSDSTFSTARILMAAGWSSTARLLAAAARMADQIAVSLGGPPSAGTVEEAEVVGPGPLVAPEVLDEIDAQREAALETEPTPQTQPAPAPEPEPEPEVAQEPEAEVASEPEPEAEVAPEPEPEAADEPAADVGEDAHPRSPEDHIAELAARPAPQVIAAINDLSTDDLRLLTEHESANKRRKTVLAAIERATRPDSALVHTSDQEG
jgi:outer membrane biosynthesis protein TonB